MKYSFVIPCYRSEKTVTDVAEQITRTVASENITDYEIILVNDGSPDNVWDVILSLAEKDSHILGIDLAKNFGQHAALLAGYSRCSGDIVVSLDDDGQSPVEELRALLDEMDTGKDVVFAVYDDIKQSGFRRFGTYFATKTCIFFLDAPKDFRGSSFYIAKKFVIDEMIRYDNAYPYLAGLILRTTRKIGYVSASQHARSSGTSGYSLSKLISLWLNGFTAFSVKPLEIGAWLGAILAFIGFIGVIAVIVNKFIHPDVAVGWSSMISVVMLIGGAIMLMLGLMGEYIGRIYICINKSPQYVIRSETRDSERKIT